MSVTTETNRTAELTCDGIVEEFDFDMLVHADTEIQVWYEVTGGAYTQLTLDTHYTVIFTEDGGTITTIGGSSPYAAGKILIIRHLELTQQTNWLLNDNHTGPQHQNDFDRSVMRDLQIQEQLDRSVSFAIHSSTSGIEFPEPSADDVIGWNAAGTELENKTIVGITEMSILPPADGNFVVGDGTDWTVESGATARASLGLTIGTHVQAYDAQLGDIAALGVTDGNFIVGDGTNWIVESENTARTSLGLGTGNSPVWTGLTITGCSVFGLNSAVFQPATNSTTAVQFLDAAGASVLNLDTVNERVGIGVTELRGKLHVDSGRSLDNTILFERSELTQNKMWTSLRVTSTKLSNMGDEFGSALSFGIRDNAGVVNTIGVFGAVRDGNDSTGSLSFRTITNGGIAIERMRVQYGGNIGINEFTPETLIELTHANPDRTVHCSTHSNANDSRKIVEYWKGEKADGTEFRQATVTVSHVGTGDDYKSKYVIGIHDAASGVDVVTDALTIDDTLLATFAGAVNITTIAAEDADVDKFLVDSSGLIKYRTGAQVLSDIGGAASGHDHSDVYEPADAGLTSLAGLTYASDSFIKVTAEDTYAICTIAETKTDLSLNNVENTAISTWAGSGNITTVGAIALGGELDAGAHTIGFTQQTAAGDGTTTINWTLGNKFYFTFGAQNDTFTFTAPSNPCNLVLVLKQDGNGSRTATWPATVLWPAGTAPTLSTGANDVDIVSLYWDGTNYFGNTSKDFS